MTGEMQNINYAWAINQALAEEMRRDERVWMMGQDIGRMGGVFGVTRGLTTAFPDRVTNSPLAEASIVGVAGGMAIAGYKPIVEIQFGDYIWPAFMQMRDELPLSDGAAMAPGVAPLSSVLRWEAISRVVRGTQPASKRCLPISRAGM